MMSDIFAHPSIGGRLTICILMYGDHYDMHKECFERIISTTSPAICQIRVVCNAVCEKTLEYLHGFDTYTLTHLVVNEDNRKKYPAMRQICYDVAPIEDKWLVWFDDDSIVVDDDWYLQLAEKIIAAEGTRIKMFGEMSEWQFHPTQIPWISSRPWFKGQPWRERDGKSVIWFCPGGFWAIDTAAMREAGIPDPEIGHNGGDYMIGAQIWQAGYDIARFNENKCLVKTSAYPRRGLFEKHTGMPGWQPGGCM